jgi:predicted nucleic acid-binding protein
LVIDASVIIGILMPDEETATASAVASHLLSSKGLVPFHWYAEVANSLALAVKRKRISLVYRNLAVGRLADFDITHDLQSGTACFGATLQLSDFYGLTVYDAAYLELAIRSGQQLASLDTALLRAARLEGIDVVGQPS